MRVLLDASIGKTVDAELRAAGHDVARVVPDPGDSALLEQAYSESRVVVTADKDFGELVFVKGLPHCGLVRLVDMRAIEQPSHTLLALQNFEQELATGAFLTVTKDRIRIRLGSRLQDSDDA